MPSPLRVRVRMYQVGFGDCFLLSVEYDGPFEDGRTARHMLVDFGSTARNPGTDLLDVANLIAQHCDGKVDVVVLSHRHADHLSGFASEKTADVIEALKPSLVVRPWTENPALASDAVTDDVEVGDRSRDLMSRLRAGQKFSADLASELAKIRKNQTVNLLSRLVELQSRNQAGIDRLDRWASEGQAAYVRYGSPSRIDEVVPGIGARVLGPPTVEQWANVKRYRKRDAKEYWALAGMLPKSYPLAAWIGSLSAPPDDEADGAVSGGSRASDGAVGPVGVLIERMRRQRAALAQRIANTVDDALNNTSVILLFEIGTKRLLFGGDAQIENWEYALNEAPQHEEVRELLRRVDLYKVGHHGSLNATPRTSLYSLWEEGDERRPMVAMLSTRPSVHGKVGSSTEVPRERLVEALRARMELHSTAELPAGVHFVEVVGDARTDDPFSRVLPDAAPDAPPAEP